MWAQLIKMRLKAGSDADLPALFNQFQEFEQTGSGLIRTTLMRAQNDPSEFYVMVVFESEEHARARENDPVRQEAMKPAQQLMAEIFEGAPEFVDLTVVADMVQ
jgi:heme-degrading monooxygenase HmoA